MNKISVALSFLLLAVCTSFAQINEKRYTISDCITSFSDERVIKNKTGWASGLFLLTELRILFQ